MRALRIYLLLLLPSLAFANGAWRAIPSRLWALQAATPPGTNDTHNTQVTPGTTTPSTGGPGTTTPGAIVPTTVPTTVIPGGVIPVAVPVGAAGPSGGAPTLPLGLPGGGGPTPMPGSSAPQQTGSRGTASSVSPTSPTSTSPTTGDPAQAKTSACEVRLSVARTDLQANAQEFFIPATRTPSGCPASIALSVSWLRVVDGSRMSLAAEQNTTSEVREATVLVGGRSLFVRQFPAAQPGFAASPGQLIFGVNKSGKTDTKQLRVWSEKPVGSFNVKPASPWLTVTPKRGKSDRQSFDVTIKKSAGLKPGRYDTQIDLYTAGASTRVLTVPVVVEVEGLR